MRSTPSRAVLTSNRYSGFDRARSRELPGHSLYIVTKRLIKRSTERWDAPSHDLLEEVYDALAEKVNDLVDDHFLRFRYGRLYHDVK